MIVIGAVLFAAAILLFVLARRNRGQARLLAATDNLTPAELVRLHREVTSEADVAGAFVQTADTSGQVRCAAPLTAPMSGTPCVHFRTVRAQIEELRVSTDADGERRERWEREDRVVSDHVQGTAFELLEGDVAVTVQADGARIDRPVVAVDRFERGDAADGGMLSIGGLQLGALQLGGVQHGGPQLGGLQHGLQLGSLQHGGLRLGGLQHGGLQHGGLIGAGGSRVLGYRHVEQLVPLGARVFVHGSADDRNGALGFRAADGRPLLISTRTEEQIVAGELRAATWQRIAALGCAAGAAGLTIATFVPV